MTLRSGKYYSALSSSMFREPISWVGSSLYPTGISYPRSTDGNGDSIAYYSANMPHFPATEKASTINLQQFTSLQLTDMHIATG